MKYLFLIYLLAITKLSAAQSVTDIPVESTKNIINTEVDQDKKSNQETEIENEDINEKTSELPKVLNEMLPQSPDFLNNVLHLQFFEEDFKTTFQYELNNNVLYISGNEISTKNFNFTLNQDVLNINWPQFLFTDGIIEIIDTRGVTRLQSQLTDVLAFNKDKFTDDYYRLCISQNGGMSRLCSAFFYIENNIINFKKTNPIERIILNNNPEKTVGKIEVNSDTSISFVVEFSNGMSYDFVSKPSPLRLYEIKQLHDNVIECIGVEPLPINNFQLLDISDEPEIILRFGFQSTIKDDRKFWKTQITPDKNTLIIRGLTGGLFSYTISPDKIRAIKLNLKPTTFTQKYSYSDKYIFRGMKDINLIITSKSGKVTVDKNKKAFSIQSELKKINEINQFQFIAEKGEDRYLGFYEIYRGLPRDVSAHLVNIITPYGYIAINEFSYLQWFSKVYNYNHYWLSNFRWGMRLQYLQNINTLNIPSLTGELEKINLSETNVELLYRLTPGIWLKDETHGLIFSLHNAMLSPSRFTAFGLGWFYQRSMPYILDYYLNYIPLFNFKKWVEMELIYHAFQLNKHIALKSNYNLNLKVKILYLKQLGIDVGFGYKKYDFSDSANNLIRNIGTFYGTMGMSYNF